MKISELKEKHPAIYDRAMLCLANDDAKYGVGPHDDKLILGAAFSFIDTKEGFEIWMEVNDGNFTPFYEFHGLEEPKIT